MNFAGLVRFMSRVASFTNELEVRGMKLSPSPGLIDETERLREEIKKCAKGRGIPVCALKNSN